MRQILQNANSFGKNLRGFVPNPDVAIQSWFGVAAPKETPATVTARIREEFIKASADPQIVKRAAEDSVTIMTGTKQEILRLLAYDYDRLGKAVLSSGRGARVARRLGVEDRGAEPQQHRARQQSRTARRY